MYKSPIQKNKFGTTVVPLKHLKANSKANAAWWNAILELNTVYPRCTMHITWKLSPHILPNTFFIDASVKVSNKDFQDVLNNLYHHYYQTIPFSMH